MTILFLLLGLVLLVAGGELLVRGAVQIAQKFRVSPLLIGLTLVGFGTSTPELVTSLQAAFAGSPGIAVGNIVGSNTANILLILGISAIIFPIAVARGTFKRDGIVLALSTLMCLGAVLYGQLTPVLGAVFVAALGGYVYFAFRQERQSNAAADAAAGTMADAPKPSPAGIALDLVFVIGGLALTILGARFLVTSAIDIARDFNVSETIIGLTIVAVGTSLPEFVTSVMAALRKHSDIAFGNIVGSNIYNVLGILGVTAMVKPIPVPPQIASLDIWVMIAATVLLFMTAMSRWRIGRVEGGLMLAAYVGYCVWLGMNSAA
ncbi:calcium/sodium antiporter [Hyphomonas sp.]|uniref:calcium/sodium antiporter n=1 Tax=Hyphomonas sp. TaxID=87 RepID=UPI0025BF086E|nr:calcium/sodium antiporter [Hyphomonas sp.]